MTIASVLLIGDSRSYGFSRYKQPKKLNTDYVVVRGAKVEDLVAPSLEKVKNTRSDLPIFVKIACGINNLTKFKVHDGGKELKPSECPSSELIGKLASFKKKIKEIRPDSLVGFVTIPTLSIEKYNTHLRNRGLLWDPELSKSGLEAAQKTVDSALDDVNAWIKRENCEKQANHNRGCRTVSWHNTITKRSKVKRKSGQYKIVFKKDYKLLYDGLHAVSYVKQKWFREVIKAVKCEVEFTLRERVIDSSSSSSDSESEGQSWDFKRCTNLKLIPKDVVRRSGSEFKRRRWRRPRDNE